MQVLTTDLKHVRSFGTKGNSMGQFQYYNDIAFDGADNLYVTGWYNTHVQLLTSEEQFMRKCSQKTNGQSLNRP